MSVRALLRPTWLTSRSVCVTHRIGLLDCHRALVGHIKQPEHGTELIPAEHWLWACLLHQALGCYSQE